MERDPTRTPPPPAGRRPRALLFRLTAAVAGAVLVAGLAGGPVLVRHVEQGFVEQIARDNDVIAAGLAAVFATIDAQDEGDAIARLQERVEGLRFDRGFACVLDARGRLLAFPDPAVAAERPAFGDRPFRPASGGAARSFAEAAGSGPAAGQIDLGAMGVQIVATRPFGDRGWQVSVHQVRGALEESLAGLGRRLALLAGLVALALLAAVALLIRREVRRYEGLVSAQEAEIRTYSEDLERLVAERSADLIRAERLAAVGALAHGISHNLRGPLTAVLGYAQILAERLPGERAVEWIVRGAEQMRTIVDTLTKRGRRASDGEAGPIDLNEVLRSTFAFLEGDLFFKHQVARGLELAPSLPGVRGVYGDFSQSLTSLVQNAIDAVRDAGRGTIVGRTRAEDGAVLVEVEDDGPGIPESVRARLFDPFFSTRPLDASGGEVSGTGLGLWSVRNLLAPYGATVTFESAPGRTVFRVRVPLERAAVGAGA